ncbi:MAG: MBL fold metallo-hydrolase [Clostridia bacterium]|nr:MBL fold metallo-hydrolase [Clostridia bacterium]
MKLYFIGAAHEVTGSCILLSACGKKILIDCGMEQGRDVFENAPLPYPPASIDCVFLTHAHIDHSGKLPLLVKEGFGGAIFATEATCELCGIMLRDSAHIQESEAEWRNRKAKRAGETKVEPLYTTDDAEDAIRLFRKCDYDKLTDVCEGIKIRFTDAGHLLGSSSIEVFIKENGTDKKIVFSGDVGNVNKPILRDPQYIKEADYVVTESTYGNRSHGAVPDYVTAFAEIIQRTLDRGGNLVIPSFAVGRTQELLYFIREVKEKGLVKGHPSFPVFVDSPLAVESTKVFNEHSIECFDEETKSLIRSGVNPLVFDGLHFAVTSEESKNINFDMSPKVIISASGMCEAGRIRHHLKHNLWRSECTVLFVGYQSEGTLGRVLLEGAKEVKLFGENIEVKAEITTINGVSGHADVNGLLKWIGSFSPKPQRVFVVHGDELSADTYAARLNNELFIPSYAPYSGDVWDLTTDTQTEFGSKKKIEKNKFGAYSPVFEALLAAGERLMAVIKRQIGHPNKDLKKMTKQINDICDKWEDN